MTASSGIITTGDPGHEVAEATPLAGLAHDTRGGISNPILGMILFICSEVMFFSGLFAAYFATRAAPISTTCPVCASRQGTSSGSHSRIVKSGQAAARCWQTRVATGPFGGDKADVLARPDGEIIKHGQPRWRRRC